MRHRRRQLRLRRPHPIRRGEALPRSRSDGPDQGSPIEDSIAAVAPGVDGLAVHFVGDAERGRRPSSQDRRVAASVIPARRHRAHPGQWRRRLRPDRAVLDRRRRTHGEPGSYAAATRGRSRDSVRSPRYQGHPRSRSPDEVRRFQGRDVTWVGRDDQIPFDLVSVSIVGGRFVGGDPVSLSAPVCDPSDIAQRQSNSLLDRGISGGHALSWTAKSAPLIGIRIFMASARSNPVGRASTLFYVIAKPAGCRRRPAPRGRSTARPAPPGRRCGRAPRCRFPEQVASEVEHGVHYLDSPYQRGWMARNPSRSAAMASRSSRVTKAIVAGSPSAATRAARAQRSAARIVHAQQADRDLANRRDGLDLVPGGGEFSEVDRAPRSSPRRQAVLAFEPGQRRRALDLGAPPGDNRRVSLVGRHPALLVASRTSSGMSAELSQNLIDPSFARPADVDGAPFAD